ncbi:MAG TPA: HD domain-containing protein [Nitrososphaeraceae archaeon]
MNWTLNEFTKAAFSRLVKQFEENTDDVVKITRAFSTAGELLSGQSRNGTKEPYINHALKVALILSDELKIHDADTICAALLHDVVERGNDQEIDKFDYLKENFGDDVSGIVQSLTEPKTVKENRDQSLQSYFENISKSSKTLRLVKLADRLDNVRFYKNIITKEKAMRYKEETQKYVVPIAEQTDETLAFKLSVALYEIK